MTTNTLHTIGAALTAACISLMHEGYHHTAITAVLGGSLYLMTI
jgi:hypothetical protein